MWHVQRQKRSVQGSEEKPKGKLALGRPRHGWEDNIKIDLQEIDWDSMNWVDLVEDRNL
jgi:hypothetical protein